MQEHEHLNYNPIGSMTSNDSGIVLTDKRTPNNFLDNTNAIKSFENPVSEKSKQLTQPISENTITHKMSKDSINQQLTDVNYPDSDCSDCNSTVYTSSDEEEGSATNRRNIETAHNATIQTGISKMPMKLPLCTKHLQTDSKPTTLTISPELYLETDSVPSAADIDKPPPLPKSLPPQRISNATTNSNDISINSISYDELEKHHRPSADNDDISDCNSTVYTSSDEEDDTTSANSDVVKRLGDPKQPRKKHYKEITSQLTNFGYPIDLKMKEKELENGPIVLSQQVGQQNSLGIPDFSNGININNATFNGTNDNLTIGTKIVCQEYTVYVQDQKQGKNGSIAENDDTNADDESNRFPLRSKAACITGSIILGLLVLGGIIVGILEATKSTSSSSNNTGDGDDSRKNIPVNSSIGDDIIAPGKVFRFVSRDEWVAQPPNNELFDLELPSMRVVIAHTATENCSTQAQCTFRTRFIQTYHMESRSFDDIGYNFLVGGDGAVYEGRGWDKEGAHSKGFNKRTICIAFIGTFIKLLPTEGQLNVTQLLIEEGLRLGKLAKDYRLYGHRQFIPTESPGDALYKIIQTWPHYSKELVDLYDPQTTS